MQFPKVTTQSVRMLSLLVVASLGSSCGILGDIGGRYETVSIEPKETATFHLLVHNECGVGGVLTQDEIPPLPFGGRGVAGVGDSGVYDVGNRETFFRMRAHLLFDVSSIPSASGDKTLHASLLFNTTRTPDSDFRDRGGWERCPLPKPVGRVARATSDWWSRSSFEIATHAGSSAAIAPDGCSLSGGEYSCTVSQTVRGWVRDPLRFPNEGFIIFGPEDPNDDLRSACDVNIGLPGNIVECAAQLENIRLVVNYQMR